MAQQRQQLAMVLAAQGNTYPPQQPVVAPNGPPMTLPGQASSPANLPGIVAAQSAIVPPPPPPMRLPMEQTGVSGVVRQDSQPVAPLAPSGPPGFSVNRPPLPSTSVQYFLPHLLTGQQAVAAWERRTNFSAQSIGNVALAYKPILLAQAGIRYQDRKSGIYTLRMYAYQIPGLEKTGIVHWDEYLTHPVDTKTLSTEPFATALYGDLSSGLTDSKRLTALQRELVDYLYNTARLNVPYNPSLKVYSNPDASSSEFAAQCAQVAREQRDAEIDKVTAQFEKSMDTLEDRLRRKERELRAEHKELSDRKREQLFTQGEAFLSLLKGRTTYTLSRTSRAGRQTRQTEEELTESQQVIREIQAQMDKLEAQLEQQLKAVNEKWAKIATDIQDYPIPALKKDIQIELFGIGWLPHWYVEINSQPLMLPAY
jgi:hypothetical protein